MEEPKSLYPNIESYKGETSDKVGKWIWIDSQGKYTFTMRNRRPKLWGRSREQELPFFIFIASGFILFDV